MNTELNQTFAPMQSTVGFRTTWEETQIRPQTLYRPGVPNRRYNLGLFFGYFYEFGCTAPLLWPVFILQGVQGEQALASPDAKTF